MHVLSLILLFMGASFILLAGLGLLRMPTLFMRMQATSKASTLGVIFMVIGLMLHVPTSEVLVKGSVICLFLLLTAPIAAHALALAAEKRGEDR